MTSVSREAVSVQARVRAFSNSHAKLRAASFPFGICGMLNMLSGSGIIIFPYSSTFLTKRSNAILEHSVFSLDNPKAHPRTMTSSGAV
jgi:hypothetical protein